MIIYSLGEDDQDAENLMAVLLKLSTAKEKMVSNITYHIELFILS